MKTTTKPTMATLKSFIRKNQGQLLISHISSFDGMTDGLEYSKGRSFNPVVKTEKFLTNTLGIEGTWFVGSSRDTITAFSNDGLSGFHVYNCCGSFDIAVKTTTPT